MESCFRLKLEPCIPLENNCNVLFLQGDESGLRIPFITSDDELEEIVIASEEGLGASPPTIAPLLEYLWDNDLQVAQIWAYDLDAEEEFLVAVSIRKDGKVVEIVDECDLVCVILLSISFGKPIFISDEVIIRHNETDFSRDVIEVLEESMTNE